MATKKKIEDAKNRIADCRNITPEQLVAADRVAGFNQKHLRAHPLVRDISDERNDCKLGDGNGIWIYLPDGWNAPATDTNSIHEDTWAECVKELKMAYFSRVTMDDPEADAPATNNNSENEVA